MKISSLAAVAAIAALLPFAHAQEEVKGVAPGNDRLVVAKPLPGMVRAEQRECHPAVPGEEARPKQGEPDHRPPGRTKLDGVTG